VNFDDQDSSLESMLRSMPLREPTLGLDARVDAAFKQFRARRHVRLYPAIAACLLIAIGIGLKMMRHKAPLIPGVVSTAAVNPIQIERDTTAVYDDGVIASTDDAAYQQFRKRTIREIWYVDPKTHAESRVVIPIEQVFIQKIDAY
jgi:hypothetical protein